PHLRIVAASTRELLLDLAAQRWPVSRDELRTDDGVILHPPSGQSVGFGALTQGKQIQEHYDDAAPVSPAHGRTNSSTPLRVRGRALVTGEHRYVTDQTVPGMLAGRVLRPPTTGATLRSLDTTAAEAMPDVLIVRDGDFVGIVALDACMAAHAIAAVRAEWHHPEPFPGSDLFSYLRTHPAEPTDGVPEPPVEDMGDLAAGCAEAALTLRASYTAAYIAHAPPEPRAAVATWTDEKLTVWTGTQRPFGVHGELALAFEIPEEQIRVIVPDTGAAYGGKHTGDAAAEAARLARAAHRPVKVVWTREEEFTQAYFRPAGVIDVLSGVRSDGSLTAWEFHNYNAGSAGIRTPYAVPNQRIAFQPTKSPLREGSYRALAATANHFARETQMDELAHATGLDPLAFRLRNLSEGRLRAVLEAAASRFGWVEREVTSGHGVGIACGTEKNSYVATCAEVDVDQASQMITVVRVVQAFECGAINNEDAVRLQNEGAIIQGLGGALFEEVRFENGKILSDRFSRYQVPRFADVPEIEVVLLDRPNLPSAGAGETPIIGIAPALGNAIFDATGVRLRSLPLAPGNGCFVV
ncbi:MAG: molybdopterin-dependent oxidoreductase, partial [Chloroflexota bacterium]|nr:molybdopterin-dependent oxidoreductase [Chloroflexota bacterium]